ncbi:MAG TPA: hypothetical protein VGG94_06500 [Chthoniobacterales bacterium]|jgi:hypothetical protein
MKNLLCVALLFTIFVCSGGAFAGTRVDAKEWSKLQTYDVRALAPKMKAHIRELVAVKFNFRDKDIHHFKPNWYEGAIWQPDPKGKKGFTDVKVLIAKKDLEAFKSITTDSSAGAEMTAYGRVLLDFDSHFPFVELLGRNSVVDPAGNATVSW